MAEKKNKNFIEEDNPALSFMSGTQQEQPAEQSGTVEDDKEKIKRLEEEIKRLKNPERRTIRVQLVLTKTEKKKLDRLANLYNINDHSVNAAVCYLINQAAERDL